jgi:glycine/D-amino acid oxidase-like deaminating enzyme
MPKLQADIAIIGGGSGGLSVAAGAVQLGAKVVLIEKHKMGGDCLNYCCVPSKALIAAGEAAMIGLAVLSLIPATQSSPLHAAMSLAPYCTGDSHAGILD